MNKFMRWWKDVSHPLHVMCRLFDVGLLYGRLWRKHKVSREERQQVVSLMNLKMKKDKLSGELRRINKQNKHRR